MSRGLRKAYNTSNHVRSRMWLFHVTSRFNKLYHGVKVSYTISLSGFLPTSEEFDIYNSQFDSANKLRHIDLTIETKVYNKPHQMISQSEIKKNDHIKFKVRIVNDYLLRAEEIEITS